MVKAKVFIFEKVFDGFPKPDDLRLAEEELPPLKNGQILVEAVYLSVDPYMRAYASTLPLGKPMIGLQVGKIIDSKHPKYPVDEHVVGNFGWRSHTIWNGLDYVGNPPRLVPKLGDLPLSVALGPGGMVGVTAYFGFLELCNPKEGETVVVSGAAGAVGCIVGQIAKIKGCRAIGIAGSNEKGKWLTEELGFDGFINYKNEDIHSALTKLAPNGVDCYFDNVGGEISSTVLRHMNLFGRVSCCGAITDYNKKEKVTSVYMDVVGKQLVMEGFLVGRWLERWNEAVLQNIKWMKEGKLKYRETVTEGFENLFTAFVEMMQGKNTGKALVKV